MDKRKSVDRKISNELNTLAETVDALLQEIAGEPVGFSLLVYPKHIESRVSYIGNCDREESTEALKQLLGYWDKGMPDIKAHEVN